MRDLDKIEKIGYDLDFIMKSRTKERRHSIDYSRLVSKH